MGQTPQTPPPPPHREQKDWQTGIKTVPCPKLRLRAVTVYLICTVFSFYLLTGIMLTCNVSRDNRFCDCIVTTHQRSCGKVMFSRCLSFCSEGIHVTITHIPHIQPPNTLDPPHCYWHLAVITGDLFKLVHMSAYTPPQYWHLVVATEAGSIHPTGMLCCLEYVVARWGIYISSNHNQWKPVGMGWPHVVQKKKKKIS